MASRASSAIGSNRPTGAVEPAARAATTNVARCPDSTAADEISTPARWSRPNNPCRTSATAVRTVRPHHEVPPRPVATSRAVTAISAAAAAAIAPRTGPGSTDAG
ncbi:MAG: hypothetical protein JWP95_1936, partial [Actinotalea sp.]|nr:hypothetical protein [Actinotalea sp.]